MKRTNRLIDKRNDDSTDNILTGLAIAGCAFLLVLFILAFFTGCGATYASPVASESTETVGTHTIDPDTEAALFEIADEVFAKAEADRKEKEMGFKDATAVERREAKFKDVTAKEYWQLYADGEWSGEELDVEHIYHLHTVNIENHLIYVDGIAYGDVNTPVGTPLSIVVHTGRISYTQSNGLIACYIDGFNMFEFDDRGYIVLPELQLGDIYSGHILGVTKDALGGIKTLAALDIVFGEWQVLAENLEEYEFSEDRMTLTYRDADTGLWQFNLNDVTAKPVKVE